MSAQQKSENPVKFRMQDTIMLTARLAQMLAEEVDLLGAMQVAKIEALQREKLFLVAALDAQRKLVQKHPELLRSVTPQERGQYQEVMRVFNDTLAENHRRLLVARDINLKIVQAITDVVRQNTLSRVYNGRGATGYAPYQALSVTLNQKV